MESIKLDQNSRELHLKWSDGFSKTIPLTTLRKECPCAPCQDKRIATDKDRLRLPRFDSLPAEAFELVELTPVGNYAISIHWKDGHATGIYPFDYLRKL